MFHQQHEKHVSKKLQEKPTMYGEYVQCTFLSKANPEFRNSKKTNKKREILALSALSNTKSSSPGHRCLETEVQALVAGSVAL
jgi:hypothetical protein